MTMYVDTAALERDVLPWSTFLCATDLGVGAEALQRELSSWGRLNRVNNELF